MLETGDNTRGELDRSDMVAEAKELLARILGIPVSSVGDDASMYRTRNWDSLAHLELIVVLEQVTNVSISPEMIEELTTLSAIARYLRAQPYQPNAPRGGLMSKSYEVKFRSFDGVELAGTITSPSDPRRGAILMVHGIDSDRDEAGFYSRMADVFAKEGWGSLRFDWRCYGYDRSRSISELTLSGIANDIEAASHVLQREIGTEHVTLVAASFGGGVSVAWTRWTSVPLNKVVLLAPVLDYAFDYLEYEGLGTRTSGVNRSAAAELEATTHLVTSGRPFSRQLIAEFPFFSASPPPLVPTLIIHGNADTGVPFENSVDYVQKHRAITLLEFPGAEHGFATPGDSELEWPSTLENHRLVYEWTVGFLNSSR